jgi:hypothetical protein
MVVVMVPSLFKTQKQSFNEEKQLTAFVRHFPKARIPHRLVKKNDDAFVVSVVGSVVVVVVVEQPGSRSWTSGTTTSKTSRFEE